MLLWLLSWHRPSPQHVHSILDAPPAQLLVILCISNYLRHWKQKSFIALNRKEVDLWSAELLMVDGHIQILHPAYNNVVNQYNIKRK